MKTAPTANRKSRFHPQPHGPLGMSVDYGDGSGRLAGKPRFPGMADCWQRRDSGLSPATKRPISISILDSYIYKKEEKGADGPPRPSDAGQAPSSRVARRAPRSAA